MSRISRFLRVLMMSRRIQRLLSRCEQLQAHAPGDRLAGPQHNHSRINLSPRWAVGIGKIELRLDGDKVLLRRSIDLDGLDLGRKRDYPQAVTGRRVDDLGDRTPVWVADEGGVIVVEVLGSQRLASWRTEIVRRVFNRYSLARHKRIVIVVHHGASPAWQVQPSLFAIAAGQDKIRMPANTHRQWRVADV